MFDYVIVGAGSAGCALAARLTEDPEVSVALVEAGPADTVDEVHIPAAFPSLFKGPLDWDYDTEPEPGIDGRRAFPAAVTLRAGSSATEDDVRQFVRERVAPYKYPRVIWLMDELPKGPTGNCAGRCERATPHPPSRPADRRPEPPAGSSSGLHTSPPLVYIERTDAPRRTLSMTARPCFHLAIPVDDITKAREFYGGVLGLEEGRSDTLWVDWNFYGHQVVTHQTAAGSPGPAGHNPVDDHQVPVPHFGAVLSYDDFHDLAGKMKAAGATFVIEPYLRFEGQAGEQWTMFFLDPAGNAMEFKAFADESQIFAK